MGLVVINHPKFVKRWTDRLRYMKATYGIEAASKWAVGMFTTEQIQLINKELNATKNIN